MLRSFGPGFRERTRRQRHFHAARRGIRLLEMHDVPVILYDAMKHDDG